ncbi:hypothetical protein GCK32_020206, partial [Trichostrongylus colubriformis]
MASFEDLALLCTINLDTDAFRNAVYRKEKINQTTSTILSVVPAISIISFLACIILCGLIIFALVRRRLPSRKYSVVLSRTVADVFSCSLLCAASFMANQYSASYTILALFLCVSTFGFVHLSLSHLLVIALRQ